MNDFIPISISIRQAVLITGIGRTSLYEAIKSGDLHVRKCGSRTLIRYDDLKQYVDDLPLSKTVGGKDA